MNKIKNYIERQYYRYVKLLESLRFLRRDLLLLRHESVAKIKHIIY